MSMESLSPQDWQKINEYLDGRMSPREAENFKQKVAQSPEAQAGIEEIREVKNLLQEMPHQPAPRNYTLSSRYATERKNRSRVIPLFRWATGFSGALTAVLLAASLIFSQTSRSLPLLRAASAPVAQSSSQDQAATAATPVMIIQWNPPSENSRQGNNEYTAAAAPLTMKSAGESQPGQTPAEAPGTSIEAGQPEGLSANGVEELGGGGEGGSPGQPTETVQTPAAGESIMIESAPPTVIPQVDLSTPAPVGTEVAAVTAPQNEQVTGSGPILGIQPSSGTGSLPSSGNPASQTNPSPLQPHPPSSFLLWGEITGGLTLILLLVTILISHKKVP